MRAVALFLVWVVGSVIFVVVSVLKLRLGAVCIIWEAVSLVLGAAWVQASFQVVVSELVWVLALLWVVGSASAAMAFTTSVTSLRCPSSIETQWL